MGIFSRFRKGVKARANSAIDKMTDPEKQLDMAILELEEQRKKAIAELLSYKATAKTMEQDIARHEEQAQSWEKKAMAAVRAGDDELAKKALRESKNCKAEAIKIRRDRDEAASYAIELNRSRKKAETKLKMLKLKKGTMATQIAAARGADSPFSTDNELWEKMRRAEEAINAEAIEAEVEAAMKGEEPMEELEGAEGARLSDAQLEARLLAAGERAQSSGTASTDDELARLKARLASKSETPGKAEQPQPKPEPE